MAESLRRSSLARRATGSPVNLERAVRAADRLGGHVVQGHVDGTGEVLSVDAAGALDRRADRAAEALDRYVVEKGSITVDGVSLTVSAVAPGWFEVSLIPTTLSATTLGARGSGRRRQPRGGRHGQVRREAAERTGGDGR
jgi:riboflavin synthase